MKKLTKILVGILCVATICVSMGALAGCDNGKTAGGEEVEITITGSTSVQPLMQKLAAAYEKNHENVIINVSGGGSGAGVTDAQSGKNDFGMASRDLKSNETGVVSQKIAEDGIALIVNKNCTVTNVTKAEVKALYENGTPIQEKIYGALSREEGSGTRDGFEEIVGIDSLFKGTGFEEGISQTSAVISKITGNNAGNTIGYISMGSLSSSVKALDYEGVVANTANVKNKTYTLARPFNIVYKSESELSSGAKAFIEWIMGAEGQAIVTANGYIAV